MVFGSRKLFKAQYNLSENGYSNHCEWLDDWQQNSFYTGVANSRGVVNL